MNPFLNGTRTLGVIPARMASTRLERKLMREIAGRPMLAWVVEAALACPQLDRLVVATDSEEIARLCDERGWPVEMTRPELPSGTDRVHAVIVRESYRQFGVVVNIQGDEPLIRAEHLSALLTPFADPAVDATTLRVLSTAANLGNPNAVKVVAAGDGRALYFSRATIPYDRDGVGAAVWKHIGLYGYRRETLDRFARLPPSPLEVTERLEQLRLLENGFHLHVATTEYDTVGVDTEEDLRAAEAILLQRPGRG